MMKFALYEFCEDNSCDVGESQWMIDEDDSSFNNNDWVVRKEVLVRWPVQPKDYSKWANKQGKVSLDISCSTKPYAAKVLKFHDEYDGICKLMENYISTGTTQTPARGKGQRKSKKSSRLIDTDDEEPLEPPKKKQKIKKKKSNSTMSSEHINMLKEKLRGKQSRNPFEDSSSQSSDEESRLEMNSMRKEILAKDKEIEGLKKQISNIKDLQNLQDIVTQLKDLVETLNQSASVGLNPKKIMIDATDTIEEIAPKYPSTSILTTVKQASSSESEPDHIMLCPGIQLSKGQKKVLGGKLSAKDFVYSALPMIWTREVLCTHSITGKKSNAHKEREAKPQLDVEKVDSLCNYAAEKYGVTQKEIKNLMTTKINNVIKCCKQKNEN